MTTVGRAVDTGADAAGLAGVDAAGLAGVALAGFDGAEVALAGVDAAGFVGVDFAGAEDEDFGPACPPARAISLGGIRQTPDEDQTDHPAAPVGATQTSAAEAPLADPEPSQTAGHSASAKA